MLIQDPLKGHQQERGRDSRLGSGFEEGSTFYITSDLLSERKAICRSPTTHILHTAEAKNSTRLRW